MLRKISAAVVATMIAASAYALTPTNVKALSRCAPQRWKNRRAGHCCPPAARPESIFTRDCPLRVRAANSLACWP